MLQHCDVYAVNSVRNLLLACSCYVPAPLRLAACATPVLHSHISFLLACRADNAEASAVAPAVSNVPAPVAHLAAAGVVVPTATTGIVSVTAEGIPAPFTYVTAHVVQTVAVRLFLCNWMCFFFAVFIIPAHFIKVVTATVLEFLSAFCRILPFFYCWQAVAVGIFIPSNRTSISCVYWFVSKIFVNKGLTDAYIEKKHSVSRMGKP